LGNLGWLWDSRGDFQRALSFHEKALTVFRAVGAPHSEAFALLGIARAERRLGHLDDALASIEEALRIVEALRGETRSPSLRTSFLALRYDFFEMAIDLLMDLDARQPGHGFAGRALEVSERARARSLLDGIAEAHSLAPASPTQDAEEKGLQGEITEAERVRRELLAAGAPALQIAAVDRRLRSLLLEADSLSSGRQPAAPDPEPLGLEEIRSRVLDRDTSLLEISLGEEKSYVWLVDQGRVIARALPKRAELEELARRAAALLPRSRERSVGSQAMLAVDSL
jgi:tetratricopeptide (TPR) repeat protein